ncbi:MAG: hypothetical protein IJ662_05640 [Clostridia bacterium]|nr:hypothetical protein [Clostridia bacterium]
MQLSQSMEQNRRWIMLAAIAALVVLLVLAVLGVFGGSNRQISAVRLRCTATQDVTPFGDSILYYDGMTLFCLDGKGNEKWSYAVGGSASFSCSDSLIAAWSGSQLHFIDRNGHSTYHDILADTVQFARVGSKYVAVVVGNDVSPALQIKDLQGTSVDNESSKFQDMIMLDVGFFGDGEYLWTTSVDIYGTAPDVTMNTFLVNMRNTGTVSLGENLTYGIIYAGNKLNVISTRQLRQYDYRGTQDTSGTVLVYGWQMVDHAINGSTPMLLFAPTLQLDDTGTINELRLLSGRIDRRYTLPNSCVGAALYNRRIYAFAHDMVYRADINAQRFTAVALPGTVNNAMITGYLGMLRGGVALLSSDNEVYAVTLP